MENIILSEVSLDEFKTRFKKLGNSKKCRDFLVENQENILNLRNPEILSFLCSEGCFHALLPLLDCGTEEQQYLAFTQVYGKKIRARVRLAPEFHKKIMKKASKNLKMMMFVRDKTVLLQGFESCNEYIRDYIYENATPEVLDYLFGWVVRYHIPIHKNSGNYLFARANKSLIVAYLKSIGSFIGVRSYVNFSMLKCMLDREDFTKEDKKEIVFLVANRCRVTDQTITKLYKSDYFW